MTYFDFELTHCPVELSLDIISRKWVLQIICDMFFGKSRFSEFKQGRPNLSNKALSRCLKLMEEENLIKKVIDDNDKTNIEYFLTEKGKSIASKMLERHIVLSDFFVSLGVEKNQALEDACKIEHDLSDETYNKLVIHIKKQK